MSYDNNSFASFVSPAKESSTIIQTELQALPTNFVCCRVLYASINAMDGKMFVCGNAFKPPEPVALGFDFSGIVLESNSEEFNVNDRVFGCVRTGGTFSQQVVVSADTIVKYNIQELPDGEASTYGGAYFSAYESLLMEENLKNRKGQWIYIPGGAGGVGHFAVQLAKHYGLRVIASASKPLGLEYLRGLGLAAVIDYSKQDVVQEIMKLTDSKGVHIAYDSTYVNSSMKQSISVVKLGGKWLKLGSWSHDRPEDQKEIEQIAKERNVVATYGDIGRYLFDPEYKTRLVEIKSVLLEAKKFYQDGMVKPWITQIIPFGLKTITDTLKNSANGKLSGKVIVEISKQ